MLLATILIMHFVIYPLNELLVSNYGIFAAVVVVAVCYAIAVVVQKRRDRVWREHD
jgi:hypothetical protein